LDKLDVLAFARMMDFKNKKLTDTGLSLAFFGTWMNSAFLRIFGFVSINAS
jgi:hypothetical protein